MNVEFMAITLGAYRFLQNAMIYSTTLTQMKPSSFAQRYFTII